MYIITNTLKVYKCLLIFENYYNDYKYVLIIMTN